jgi:1,4-dihydroxy-6-naphthoate synthase
MKTSLTIGFSPCPNDTFIFDALVNGKIESPFTFETKLHDVEELNKKAFANEYAVTKLSYHAWLHLQDQYTLLEAGSALGMGCGPLLISKPGLDLSRNDLRIAIPGRMTTANFLFSACYPQWKSNTIPMLFSDIEIAILNNVIDAGVIIHENRFTYQDKGLVCIQDLGDWWESTTGAAIPLGCIAVRKDLAHLKEALDASIRASLDYSYAQGDTLSEYIQCHAQEMSTAVMRQHIDLYVNRFTYDLGVEGHKAIDAMQAYWTRLNA